METIHIGLRIINCLIHHLELLLYIAEFCNCFCPWQDEKLPDLETNHFVLVHGGGFGAWCWYKTIALLEEGGFKVTAIDLTGAGIHSFDTNGITSLSQYVKPLTDFLEKLPDAEKVPCLYLSILLFLVYLLLFQLVLIMNNGDIFF